MYATIKEKQKRWDQLLITGWIQEKTMGWCLYKLSGDVFQDPPDLTILEGLKRANDGKLYLGWPVRYFIYCSSSKLSDLLWDSDMPMMLAFSLDRFSFKRMNKNESYHAKHQKIRKCQRFGMKRLGSHKYSSDGKHEWSTIR